jgi:hypothetical protein
MARRGLKEREEKMLTIRVPERWHASLKKYCEEQGSSITFEMRTALVSLCERNNIKLT